MTPTRRGAAPGADNTARPRRSCLYMPGTNARAHEKARGLAADVLIFDLEDSVAPDAKEAAREAVLAALAAGGYGERELVVRVNGPDTPWGADDLRAVAGAPADAILLPKVGGPDDVAYAARLLGGAGAGPSLWTMVETARAVLEAPAVADADPRLRVLALGLEDLAAELRADSGDATALLYARERVVLAARAAGRAVIDGVHRTLDDAEGFAAACAEGRRLGFDGKQLIHPAQIGPANAAFAPAPEAVAEARRVIEAYEAARRAGRGLAVLDGRMVEALHVAEARRVVAFAEAVAAREGAETARR